VAAPCPGRKPSASDRLEAATEAAQSSRTDVGGTGSTRPWARDLPGIGPNRYPLPGVIRLEFLSPRFFGGASTEETARTLSVSARTVEREWRSARAWLFRLLGGNAAGEAP